MGSFYGSGISDLVGLYFLKRVKTIFDSYGIHKSNELVVVDLSKTVVYDRNKTTLSDISFKMTLDLGTSKTDCLYETLNLTNETFVCTIN